MHSLRNRAKTSGTPRVHSAAMSEQHMKKIHDIIIESMHPNLPDLLSRPEPIPDEKKADVTRGLFYLAFSVTGWTLWTRYCSFLTPINVVNESNFLFLATLKQSSYSESTLSLIFTQTMMMLFHSGECPLLIEKVG
jgi:cytochrome b subunit of formate dehydrogenase